MKKLAYKFIIAFILLAVNGKAQLPTVDISTSDIRTALGLTGETTFQAMCNAANVNKYGLNATYCSGADADARLTNLQSTPYDIGKFRGYDHNASGGCTLSVDISSFTICDATITQIVNITASGSWTLIKTSGSIYITPNVYSGSGNTQVTFTASNLHRSISSVYQLSSDGCTSININCSWSTDCI